jgi:cytosine deaminase
MDEFMQAAFDETRRGLAERHSGGSVLVLDGKIIGRGHNAGVRWEA